MLTNWQSGCIQESLIKDVETAVKLFGLDYNAGLEDYAWEMGLDQPKVVVADWLGKFKSRPECLSELTIVQLRF
jgi:hypothetical protein